MAEKTIYDLPYTATKALGKQIKGWLMAHETDIALDNIGRISRTITANKEDWNMFYQLLNPKK